MKSKFLSLFGLAALNSIDQSPEWQWAKRAGGNLNDEAASITSDNEGNVIAAGSFRSTSIVFGSEELTNADDTGTSDIFIVKYNTLGNVLWAKREGGNGMDRATCVCTDNSGNVFAAGNFRSHEIKFGNTILTNSNTENEKIFLVKYDSAGNTLWAKSAGGSSYDGVSSVAADSFGNVYMTGSFSSPSLVFGSFVLINSNIKVNSVCIYIAKYDASGILIWAKSAGGNSNDYAMSVAADTSGNVFAAGFFYSPSIVFDTVTLTKTHSADNVSNMFIVKYDAAGNVLWAKNSGRSYRGDMAVSVVADAAGNIFTAGSFTSLTIEFGDITLTNTVNDGSADMFIVKYNAEGNVLWAKSGGGIGWDNASSIAADASGNVFVIGNFQSPSVSFGSIALRNTDRTGKTTNMFFVKYDASGNVLWAKSAGGRYSDRVNSVTADSYGSIFAAGSVTSPAVALGSITLTNNGNSYGRNESNADRCSDIFIAKLGTLSDKNKKL